MLFLNTKKHKIYLIWLIIILDFIFCKKKYFVLSHLKRTKKQSKLKCFLNCYFLNHSHRYYLSSIKKCNMKNLQQQKTFPLKYWITNHLFTLLL